MLSMPELLKLSHSKYTTHMNDLETMQKVILGVFLVAEVYFGDLHYICLLYTSPSPRDQRGSRMPSSA